MYPRRSPQPHLRLVFAHEDPPARQPPSRCRQLDSAALSAIRLAGCAGPAFRVGTEPAGHHDAEGAVRPRHRRRLPPGQLHAVRRVPAEARSRIRPHDGRRHRQDGRRPARECTAIVTSPENHRQLAQFKDIEPPARARRRAHRRAGAAARARRQDGRLDRRRPARDRSARRAAADRDRSTG